MRSVAPKSTWIAVSLGFFIWSLGIFVATAGHAASQNLLINGDLSAGSPEMPDHWAMTTGAPSGSYAWLHGENATPALEIGTSEGGPRYKSWSQTVNLAEAGWYRIRAEVKTENPRAEAIITVKGPHGSGFVAQRS